ncbi:MAG TPA: class I SAM-dependent methyltransferase [Acidimicrobiia bacterium]|nr:class I SAM-dependent methyltransferase [Acidimicrobiia bacterium]
MEVEEYARIAAVEDDHWWYRNTRALVADLLTPRLRDRTDLRVLDAGCGPGGNGAWLAGHGTVVGVDRSSDALRFVRERRRAVLPVLGDLTRLPLATGAVDVAIAVTVLYAVDDDDAALRELARVLAPEGALVLVEPAFPSLRREHDATVHGRRRYRRAPLRTRVEQTGLRVERATYAYSFLAPAAGGLALLDRARHRRRPPEVHDTPAVGGSASDVERRALDAVFAPMGHAERRALARVDLPVGTSVLVLASKPATG